MASHQHTPCNLSATLALFDTSRAYVGAKVPRKSSLLWVRQVLRMELEKYPESLSGINLVDAKQMRYIVASLLELHKGVPQGNDVEFEMLVTEFLTVLGAGLFAHTSSPRASPLGSMSLKSEVELSGNLQRMEPWQDHETTRKKPLNLVTSVKHVPPRPRLLPVISVPSHIVGPRVQFPVDLTRKPGAISKDVRQRREREKKEFALRFRTLLKQRILERGLKQADLVNRNSKWQQIEKRLLYDALPRELQRLLAKSLKSRANVKVIVVGAGLAGLSAAQKLLSSGFKNVIVLEAQNRVGGRIQSIGLNEADSYKLIDTGSPCIDYPGPENTVYQLAASTDLLDGCLISRKSEDSGQILGRGRRRVSTDLSDLLAPFCNGVLKEADLVYREVCQNSPQDRGLCLSSADYRRERRRRLTVQMLNVGCLPLYTPCEVSQATKSLLARRQYSMGDDKGDLASHMMGFHKEMNGDDVELRLRGGMASVIKVLTSAFLLQTIRFKAAVETVDWSEFNVKNTRDGKDSKVKVTCRDGRVFEGHHVIMTVPLGHLKEHAHKMFKPSLSKEKLEALNTIGFGCITKVFLIYDKPLRQNPVNFVGVGLDRPSADGCRKLFANAFRLRTHPVHDNILELSLSGAEAEDIRDEDIVREVSYILNLNFDADVPEPVQIYKTKWRKNPFIRGTHPYLTTACSGAEMGTLAEPLRFRGNPVVLFAGDATFEHYRCLTHAARASGLREAERLANLYNDLFQYANTMN
ncbi:peroxisomal N(1)-acetyl-spermine/spermidine oxidase isoform X1 [Aplysia californica]|uniref:Peroxisomal N(1)-acetyl-spermine/spermidine oxidase isoform X1 n=1 Tax=Aplysia californica TaxID=6500 RepID=A0ABM0K9R5_APLCA|nr:peroxisomal N(1)-acetyl-spermine/spermidine oxidase isoform X1 [Aplysia californica]